MTSVELSYQSLEIASSYDIPESLRQIISRVWTYHYQELYEDGENSSIVLEDVLKEVLAAFEENEQADLCYIRMAVILAEAVQPTIKAYLPDETVSDRIFQWIEQYSQDKATLTERPNDELLSIISAGYQALDEALDVFRNVLRVCSSSQAKATLLEILDDCLEGYAIFPGSQGRRDLFNWWLLEVVPAAWCLKSPSSLCTLKGLIPVPFVTIRVEPLIDYPFDDLQE